MIHNIAHRGASAYEPENTLRAFERAIQMGATMLELDYVHPCWERASPTLHKLLTSEMIAGIRRRGLGIIVWHEERPAELRELVRLDVDGICTNTPDLLAGVLARATPTPNQDRP
jgi:glycerophosphoryl diester phosphodiesterase